MKSGYLKSIFIVSICFCSLFCAYAEKDGHGTPITRADNEELASAIGHYSQARALLIAAIREFDKGLKYANPEQVIDVKELRHTLLDQAETLEKILDPQPRTTKYGIRFEGDSRLLTEAYR
jgi:hypothetical protein